MKKIKKYLNELKKKQELLHDQGQKDTIKEIISEIETIIDINKKDVNGVVEIKKERMEDIEEVLKFYSDGKHYEWSGCRCHGNYVINDEGGMAKDCLFRIYNDIDIEEYD
jgi:hypothetical protein